MPLLHCWKRCLAIVFAIATLVLLLPTPVWANPSPKTVDIWFFHSETCPNCQAQMPLMQDIATLNPEIKLHIIEVRHDAQLWEHFLKEHQIQAGAVPRTVVGDKHFVGYDPADGDLEYVG
jgi:thiol-disulfide isomerase/thioredoxin